MKGYQTKAITPLCKVIWAHLVEQHKVVDLLLHLSLGPFLQDTVITSDCWLQLSPAWAGTRKLPMCQPVTDNP